MTPWGASRVQMRLNSNMGVPKLHSVADRLMRVFIKRNSVYNILMRAYAGKQDTESLVDISKQWINMYTGGDI